MPGYIMHLAAAKLALDKLGFNNFGLSQGVYLGSIIPDAMARESKRMSHFWDDEVMGLLKRVPNVERFEKQYGARMDNPTVAAYYAHLVMDNRFVNVYWNNHFEFFDDNMKPEESYEKVTRVRIKDSGRIFDREVFLSDDYYYGDYTRLLGYIIKKYNLSELFFDYEHNRLYDMDVYSGYINEQLAGKRDFPIKEIEPAETAELCTKMISNVYKIAVEDNNYRDYPMERPELKVFVIDELEKLIEEISEILKNVLRKPELFET